MNPLKILITGVTAQQCGRKTRLDHVKLADILATILRNIGHDVDVRRLDAPDEPLGQYDLLLVGLSPFMARGTYYAFDVVNIVMRAQREGCALSFFVDDWKFPKIVSDAKVALEHPEIFARKEVGRRHQEWADADHGVLRDFAYALVNRPWPPTIVPAFSWGDHSELIKRLPQAAESMYVVDPTSYVKTPPGPMYVVRERNWTLGALRDHSGWVEKIDTMWPVLRYGGGGAVQITEPSLVDVYRRNRGILAPPYGHSGSGWWRVRFQHAADTGSVLLAEHREVQGLGHYYTIGTDDARSVETSDDHELDYLAARQREAFYAWVTPATTLCGIIRLFVEEAMDKRKIR